MWVSIFAIYRRDADSTKYHHFSSFTCRCAATSTKRTYVYVCIYVCVYVYVRACMHMYVTDHNLCLLEMLPRALLTISRAYTIPIIAQTSALADVALKFCESNTRQSAFQKDNATASRWRRCNFIKLYEAKPLSHLWMKLIYYTKITPCTFYGI